MTELTTTLRQIESVGEKAFERAIGFQDRKRYEEILNSMRGVEHVGQGNSNYVRGMIQRFDLEMARMEKEYGKDRLNEYETQRERLIKLLRTEN